MKLSEQLKKQLFQVESSLEICQQILNKKSKEEETEEWLENWSRWTDWQSVLFFWLQAGGSVADFLAAIGLRVPCTYIRTTALV